MEKNNFNTALDFLDRSKELFSDYGIWGILVAVVLYFSVFPKTANYLNSLLVAGIFRATKWCANKYIANSIENSTSHFFNSRFARFSSFRPSYRIKVRWVSSPSDPILAKDGAVILRLHETVDQARNVLTATKAALPHMMLVELRPNLQKYVLSAIDLTILRKLSEDMGKHARSVFIQHLLEPEIHGDERIALLYTELVQVDSTGLFAPIFMEELALLGEQLYAEGKTFDSTEEIIKFLNFLLTIARREVGQEIELGHFSTNIKVGIIMVARARTVALQGSVPYIKWVNRYVARGCDSIYIIGFANKPKIFQKLLDILKEDERLFVVYSTSVSVRRTQHNQREKLNLSLIRVNRAFADMSLRDRLSAIDLQQGSVVKGRVVEVSAAFAVIDVDGFTGIVDNDECSWSVIEKCQDCFLLDEKYDFKVIAINEGRGIINLSRRLKATDPWEATDLPNEGEIIEVGIVGVYNLNYVGRYEGKIEILIPFTELEWFGNGAIDKKDLLGSKQRIIVTEKDSIDKWLKGSVRRCMENPWESIYSKIDVGRRYRGTVYDVTEHSVRVEFSGGIRGYIPKTELRRVGFELGDFQNTVVAGQGIDVIVKQVFVRKRKIELGIARK